MRWVTRKPPKMLIEAKMSAIKPSVRAQIGPESSATSESGPTWARILGFIALVFASVNIFGGFLVTQRMLGMYKKREAKK